MTFATSLAATSLLLLAAEKVPDSAASLFDSSKVWTVHLTFTADQWEEMEPKGGPRPGGPGGPGGMRMGGPPGGFGPAMMLMPAFVKGDANKDGKLSREEFAAMGDEWFTAWDAGQHGKLTEAEVRSGANTKFRPEGGFPGPMPFGGPGRNPAMGMQGREGGRNGASAMAGIEFEYVHADLDFNGRILKDVAVRYKGNSTFMQSRNSLKRSLKVDLNRYVKGQQLAGITTLNLHSNVSDPALMNEPLSYRLFRDASVPSPRTSYARVYLTVPGKYQKQYVGLYSVVEGIDTSFAQERFSSRDGAIFKPSTRSLFAYLGDDWAKYRQIYDPKTALSPKQKARVIEFAKLVTNADDADFAAQLHSYIDVDEFARYMAVNVWLANMDSILSMGQNFYLYLHPATNRFLILPWDLDLSFGRMGGSVNLSIAHPWRGQNRFLERLFQVKEFKDKYWARMAEFNQSQFKADQLARHVDQAAKVIRRAVGEESDEKLALFDKSVAGEAVAGGFAEFGGRGPGGPGGMPGLSIKKFAEARVQAVTDQLAGRSKGEEGGFGGPGGPGGPGRPGFGPGNFIAPSFVRAMDHNKDGVISREEFQQGFAQWFQSWGGDKGPLSEGQIRAGIERDLVPRPGMPF